MIPIISLFASKGSLKKSHLHIQVTGACAEGAQTGVAAQKSAKEKKPLFSFTRIVLLTQKQQSQGRNSPLHSHDFYSLKLTVTDSNECGCSF